MTMPTSLRPETAPAPQQKTNSIREMTLGLLARALPKEALLQANAIEAKTLRAFADLFAGFSHTDWLEAIQEALSEPASEEEALVNLCQAQGLSLLETLVLFLCDQVESDAMTGRCIAYIQHPLGGSRPTLGLLNAMLLDLMRADGQHRSPGIALARIANSKAVQLGLLKILNESAPLPERPVQLPAAVSLAFSAGEDAWPGATIGLADVAYSLTSSVLSSACLQGEALASSPNNVLVLRGAAVEEASITADVIAQFLGYRPLFISEASKALPALGPVCGEKKWLPVFRYDCGPGEQIHLPEMPGYEGPVIVLAGIEGSFESPKGSVTAWTIPRPNRAERKHLWQMQLGNEALSTQLADDHVHTTSRIIALSKLAKRQSIADQKKLTTLDEIRKAGWLSENSGLASLAQVVMEDVSDEALILRKQTRDQLGLLAQRCRIRERLTDQLGITLQTRYQMGVKGLFIGPSGTGKTLAASWLATRLGLPLYRVDLAAITSKYIGETEKNLAKILAHAEQQEVILLFDEADALFSKRTDVKDANDRFANTQTNYLLQRIETYSGIVLLTSNSKSRFDSAFTRRLDMIIDFPLPNPEERRAIWMSHLGEYHVLSKAQINQLAVQCDFCGGHIRNAVLTAAVIAKQNKRRIVFEDILIALTGEYRKLGKQMPSELSRVMQKNKG